MTKNQAHQLAATIEHLSSSFQRIKTLSTSGEIDRVCLDGVAKLVTLRQSLGIEETVQAIHDRRVDPMM